MNQKSIINVIFLSVLNVMGLENIDPNLKGLDDSVLFKINWPGKEEISNEIFDVPEFQQITVTTENKEKYRCLIPQLQEKEKNFSEKYNGPNPLDLMAPLFKQSSCSHKLEAYWTYELCHGRYIRQYHEEREGKMIKIQEYYLGKWNKYKQEDLREELEKEKTRPPELTPIKKIDGLNMPYLQLNMTDGTVCDLSSKPRLTRVLYICYIHGKHEIYSLKETSICEYEVIVLSPLLCDHPRYRPQESGEHVINCHPVGNTPKKPKDMLQMEAESLRLRHQKANDDKMQSVFAVFSVDKVGGEEVSQLRVEIHPIDDDEEMENQTPGELPLPEDPVSSVDQSLSNFLSGTDCIQGDSGWWKYEFCYGKNVVQYHVEKDGTKTVINLGNFVKSAHLEWLQANPHKMPEPLAVRRHVSHFYSGGSICEKTGKPRHTEVKLKCMDTNTSHGSVSLYLLEPKVCQYVLVVESGLICQLLTKVDENGLYDQREEFGFSKATYRNGYQPYGKDGDEHHRDKAPQEHRDRAQQEHRDRAQQEHRDRAQQEHRDRAQQEHRDKAPQEHWDKAPQEHWDKAQQDQEKVDNKDKAEKVQDEPPSGLASHIPDGDD